MAAGQGAETNKPQNNLIEEGRAFKKKISDTRGDRAQVSTGLLGLSQKEQQELEQIAKNPLSSPNQIQTARWRLDMNNKMTSEAKRQEAVMHDWIAEYDSLTGEIQSSDLEDKKNVLKTKLILFMKETKENFYQLNEDYKGSIHSFLRSQKEHPILDALNHLDGETLKALAKNGANFNDLDTTQLTQKQKEMLEDAKTRLPTYPILQALKRGDRTALKTLAKNGAKFDYVDSTQLPATQIKMIQDAKKIQSEFSKNNPVQYALNRRDETSLKALAENGANFYFINTNGLNKEQQQILKRAKKKMMPLSDRFSKITKPVVDKISKTAKSIRRGSYALGETIQANIHANIRKHSR
jgi:hypothetical protein